MAASDFSAALRQVLSATVSDLHRPTEPQHVVVLKDTATVEQTLRALASHSILSAPVVSVKPGAESPQGHSPLWPADAPAEQILGFVDVRDLMESFLKEVDLPAVLSSHMLKRMTLLEGAGAVYASKALKELQLLGRDGRFLHEALSKGASLQEIMHQMLYPGGVSVVNGVETFDPKATVHRLAVFSGDGRIRCIISQKDILRYVAQHSESLGPLLDTTVAEHGWASRGAALATVHPETAAVEGLIKMRDTHTSGMPVVDSEGHLLGSFSGGELRTMLVEHFGTLALPVGEFLALEHGTEFWGVPAHEPLKPAASSLAASRAKARAARATRTGVEAPPPATHAEPPSSPPGRRLGQHLNTATPASSVRQVMQTMLQHHIHRVWVLDEEEKPQGVVTATDLLRLLDVRARAA